MKKLKESFPLVMIFGLVGLIAMIILVFSADLAKSDDTMAVTAVVSTSVTCTADPATTAFGTLTTSSVYTSSPNASSTTACNSGAGCTLYIQDAGNGVNPGLATTTPAYLIASTAALLVGGTEGYGIQATTTAVGSGQTLNLAETYNKIGNNVGALATTTVEAASSTGSINNRELIVTHMAAISGLTSAANYEDTITYSCVGN